VKHAASEQIPRRSKCTCTCTDENSSSSTSNVSHTRLSDPINACISQLQLLKTQNIDFLMQHNTIETHRNMSNPITRSKCVVTTCCTGKRPPVANGEVVGWTENGPGCCEEENEILKHIKSALLVCRCTEVYTHKSVCALTYVTCLPLVRL
jgi:hypothetical protein